MSSPALSNKVWTLLEVLKWSQSHFENCGFTSARLDAEILIAHVLHLPRIRLYLEFDRPLDAEELAAIRPLIRRRAAGEPVAYLIGEREFWSLPFAVNPSVLIPRPDTEHLVETALQHLRHHHAPKILDIGTGSGCIACALAKELPTAKLWAVDISDTACDVARNNVQSLGFEQRITVTQSDLFVSLPQALHFDAIVANLPYIKSSEMSELAKDVRDFEPQLALYGGVDGLDLISRLVQDASARLLPKGVIVLEIGHTQGAAVADLLAQRGFDQIRIERDLSALDRVVAAVRN